MNMNFKRILRHFLTPPWTLRRAFPVPVMNAITEAIRTSERRHRGEVRFAVESVLDWRRLLRNEQPPERARDVFSILRVWDTEENNGVLIYLLLADRHVEIVADRGLHRRVGPEEWAAICRSMEAYFAAGRFEEGLVQGLQAMTEILAREYPLSTPSDNELPDEPVVVK